MAVLVFAAAFSTFNFKPGRRRHLDTPWLCTADMIAALATRAARKAVRKAVYICMVIASADTVRNSVIPTMKAITFACPRAAAVVQFAAQALASGAQQITFLYAGVTGDEQCVPLLLQTLTFD